jgi:hypothetical protein
MAKEIEPIGKGISKKVRTLSSDGCVLTEKSIHVFGSELSSCYKYLRRVENDD